MHSQAGPVHVPGHTPQLEEGNQFDTPATSKGSGEPASTNDLLALNEKMALRFRFQDVSRWQSLPPLPPGGNSNPFTERLCVQSLLLSQRPAMARTAVVCYGPRFVEPETGAGLPESRRPFPEATQKPKVPSGERWSCSWHVPSENTSITRPTVRARPGALTSSTLRARRDGVLAGL